MVLQGAEREKALSKEDYYNEKYFGLEQMCSIVHQLHDITQMKPKSFIEIGIGNGFTSTLLKRSGIQGTTVDINDSLEPDICAPINEIKNHLSEDKKFDLVICCEVLEHIPFDEFIENIKIFRSMSSRLYLSLPSYKPSFGISGFIRLPKFRKLFGIFIDVPRKKRLEKEHFWELGSSKETSKNALQKILREYYPNVTVKRQALKPNHYAFIAE